MGFSGHRFLNSRSTGNQYGFHLGLAAQRELPGEDDVLSIDFDGSLITGAAIAYRINEPIAHAEKLF